ncbi:FUSC family protein [Planosporangium sp. 12N6]|uniref:FUSC family protein n=1 Tax=Planosporangium spinosum TaxID=3402278 RepID=UPI003CE8E4C9
MSRLTPRPRRRLPVALRRYGRVPGLRTAKTTLAAVLAYVVADAVGTSAQPVLASLTALLVVQLTMYDTVAHGVQRVASVLAGVLVALGVATFAGLTWWSLGAVVAVSLVVGLLLRLGPHLLEVPISAMLVLAVGGAEEVAVERVYETLVGAAVGVLVNLVIVPPLHVRPAGAAIGHLADRMARLLRGLAGDVRANWSRAAADHWLTEARALGAEVARADRSLERAEQSARLNPRTGTVRQVQPLLRTALTGLEHGYVSLRNLCRALFDRTYFLPTGQEARAYDEEERTALADVLECAAAALESTVPLVAGTAPADAVRMDVDAHLAELHRRRDRLGEVLVVDPRADQGAWQQHGALVAAVDRLRVEVEAAVRPPETSWRPALVTDRQRLAFRRVVDAAAHAAGELPPYRSRTGLRGRLRTGRRGRDRAEPDGATGSDAGTGGAGPGTP